VSISASPGERGRHQHRAKPSTPNRNGSTGITAPRLKNAKLNDAAPVALSTISAPWARGLPDPA
jgi:hypothetical protein